jgi:hypothetical protein
MSGIWNSLLFSDRPLAVQLGKYAAVRLHE